MPWTAEAAIAELLRIAQREDTSPKEGEHKYGSDAHFADPVNEKYPLDTAEHVKAALSYWGNPENRAKYSAADQKTIGERIHAAAKRLGIGQEQKQAPAFPTWFRAFHPENVTDVTDRPGVVGSVRGIALVYGVLDMHRTVFERGSLAKTMERVRAGKVKLYWDHGDAAKHGAYDTDLHIGIVRAIRDVQLPDGRWAAEMEADLFDTPMGREKHHYLKTVRAAGGETGLSIGMMEPPRAVPMTWPDDNKPAWRITEFGLREISVTGENSVPGTTVLEVRQQTEETPPDGPALLEQLLATLPEETVRSILAAHQVADERDTAPHGAVDHASEGTRQATPEERAAAFRATVACEVSTHGSPAQGAGGR